MAEQDEIGAVRAEVRELRAEVAELRARLDTLVTGPAEVAAAAAAPPQAPPLEVIPDRDYDRDMWVDAEDEGLGARDRRAP